MVDDGVVDDDKKGVGVMFCNLVYFCTNGGEGTFSMCTCSPVLGLSPECVKFNIFSFEFDCDDNFPGFVNGACEFYLDVFKQKLNLECIEEEEKEFLGYYETCSNVL